MKENLLDVLMYLFENYLDEEEELTTDRDNLQLELNEAGFAKGDIERALVWLEDLTKLRESGFKNSLKDPKAFRVYTENELKKLNLECRGFLLFLEQIGVLGQQTREMVIDRVMALGNGVDIDIDQLKWVILMVVFNQPGQEESMEWIEDLVFDEVVSSLH